MKRNVIAALVCTALAVPALRADVKTREKTTFALEGVMGGIVRTFGGKAAKEGITSDVALKGDRKLSISDVGGGQIIDLHEQKVYTLDVKKKEYKVQTFAEIRAAFEKAKADAEKQAKDVKPEDKEKADQAAKQMEFEINVKKTGEKKSLAGYDTEEVVVTVTGHEKGKSLDESGGFVMTSDLWMAPKIAALDELGQFQLKYMRAVYGESFVADMQQMAAVMAMYPSFKTMATQMQTEGQKMQGTPISSTVVFEAVKSAEQMKAADSQKDSGGGGGLGGMLGKKLMGNRAQPTQRAKVMTTTHDMLSVATTVSAADVAMPDGYKEKK
ncbi:MAG: hypothetical protein ABI634_10495 [Acidobacteriota bacterium]